MSTKIAPGGGGTDTLKRSAPVLLATAVVLLSCLVLIPSTDEAEAAPVIDITDVSVNSDADWSDLHSYTNIQTLKDNFTVTATVDGGAPRSLTNDEFYLSTGGPLVNGQNTFTVVAYTQDGEDVVEETFTVNEPVTLEFDDSYSLSSLTVTPPESGKVFPSTTDAEFKNLAGFRVTANFTNGSGQTQTTDVVDFTIDCNYNSTDPSGTTVSIRYGNENATFNYVITPLEPVEITDVEQTGEVYSGYNVNGTPVKNATRVEVVMNDGKTHSSDDVEFEYTVSGSLYTGADATDTSKTLTFTLPNGNSYPKNFTVTPSTPRVLDASEIDTSFPAFTDPEGVTVSIVFSNPTSTKQNVSEGLNFYFYPEGTDMPGNRPASGDGHIEDIDDPQDGLRAGSYTLYITYTEGETIVSDGIQVEVVRTAIPYPYIVSSSPSFNNDYMTWSIDDFNPALEYTIASTPQVDHQPEIVDGEFRAMDVAVYKITFSIPTGLQDSYQWDDTRPSDVSYTVEIRQGEAVIGIVAESIEGWVFGDTSRMPRFTATLQGADPSKADVTSQVDWNSDSVTIQYRNEAGSILNAIDHAGNWQVRVIVGDDAAGNLTLDPSEWFSFTVSPDTLTAKVTGTYVYNGTMQTPTIAVEGAFLHDSIGYTCSTAETNAGTYDVEIVLTNTTDYVWKNPESGNPSVTVLEDAWTISKLGVPKPTIDGAVDSSITTTYNAAEQSWTVTNFDDSYLGFGSSCTSDGASYDGATLSETQVSGTQVSARDAGTYTIVFSIDSDHQWNDGTTGDVTFTITVAKADLTLNVTVDPITYGDDTPVFSSADSTEDDYDLVFGWLGTDGYEQIAGDSFEVYTDYVRTDDGQGDVGVYPVKYSDFESRNYNLTTVTGSLTVQKKEIVISSVTTEVETYYRDAAPSKDMFDFTYDVDGLAYASDWDEIYNSIQLSFSGYASGSNAGDYDIGATADCGNYTVHFGEIGEDGSYSGVLGVLEVLPIPVGLTWSSPYTSYVALDTPPTVTVAEYRNGAWGAPLTLGLEYEATWTTTSGGTVTDYSPGTYNLTLTLKDDGHYSTNFVWRETFGTMPTGSSIILEITINQAEINLDLDNIEVTYGTYDDDGFKGLVQGGITIPDDSEYDAYRDAIQTALESIGNLSLLFNGDTTGFSELDVGTYTMTVIVDAGIENRFVSAQATVTINKATVTMDAIRPVTGPDYNAIYQNVSVQLPITSMITGNEIDWNFNISEGGSFVKIEDGKAIFSVRDAGEYTVTYNPTSTNYAIDVNGYTSFTITIGDGELTIGFPDSYSYQWKYGESVPEEPSVTGAADETITTTDHWTFTVDGGSSEKISWDDLMAKVNHPNIGGTQRIYTVVYEFSYDNYGNEEGTLTFTVDPATISSGITVDGSEYTDPIDYRAENIGVVLTPTSSTGQLGVVFGQNLNVEFRTTDGSQTSTVFDGTGNSFDVRNAGTYTITYIVSADYHETQTFTYTVVVDPAAISLDMENFILDYSGTTFTSITGIPVGVGSDIDWHYSFTVSGDATESISDTTSWGDLQDVLIDAGVYTVAYTVSAENHVTTDPKTFTVTINKATFSPTVTGPEENHEYSGTAHPEIVHSENSTAESADLAQLDLTWTFHINGATDPVVGWDALLNELVNAGTYTITYEVSADNHETSSGPGNEFTITIDTKPLSFDQGLLSQMIGSWTEQDGEQVFDGRIHYGDDAPEDLDSLVTGFVQNEGFGSVFSEDSHVSINYSAGQPAGSVNASQEDYLVSGTELRMTADNYDLSGLTFHFEVEKRPITVTTDNKSTEYGQGFDGELTVSYGPGPLYSDDEIIDRIYVIDPTKDQEVDWTSTTLDVGTYRIEVSFKDDDNYEITTVNGTFTVGKRVVSIQTSSNGSDQFDGNELDLQTLLGFFDIDLRSEIPESDYTFDFLNSDGESIGNPVDVGTYSVRIGLKSDSNYTLAGDSEYVQRGISITPAVYDVTLALNSTSSDYNGTLQTLLLQALFGGNTEYESVKSTTIMDAGIEGEEDLTVTYYVLVNGEIVGSLTDSDGLPAIKDAGTYTIRAVLDGSDNYMIRQFVKEENVWPGWGETTTVLEATFTIDPYTIKETDIQWTVDKTFIYDGTDQSDEVEAWIVGLGDDGNINLTLGDVDFTHYREEGYEFIVTGVESSDSSKNYRLPESYDWKHSYKMNKMQVTITAYDYVDEDDDDKHNAVTYGSPPSGGYETHGWEDMIKGDYKYVYAGTDAINTNPYAGTPDYTPYTLIGRIVPEVVWSDEYLNNKYDDYQIYYVNGNLDMKQRELRVDVMPQSVEYNGSVYYSPEYFDDERYWDFAQTSNEIIEGDSVGIRLSFVDGFSASEADVYENKIRASLHNLDQYVDNPNYSVVTSDFGDFTINPKRVTLEITPNDGDYTGTPVDTPYTGYIIRTDSGTLTAKITWGEFTYTLNGKAAESILDAGEYTVNYTASLKNYALYDSSDDTVPNAGTFIVTISQADNWWVSTTDPADTGWKDDYQYGEYTYLGSPVLPTGSFTSHFSNNVVTEFYRGEVSDDNYLGTLGDPYHPWQFTNTTPAGDYTVRVKVPGNTNFKDLIADYQVHIERCNLDAHWQDEVTYLEESGESATNKLVGYDPELMRLTLNATIGGDGMVTVTDFGTYSAILTLTDESFENYMWEGRPDDQSIECTWYVVNNAVANHWDTVPSIRDWTYGDQMPSYTAGEATYGGVATVKFYLASDTERQNPLDPVDAGEYVMVSTVPAGETEINGVMAAYQGMTQETEFTIHPYRVSVPEMVSVEYTGEHIDVPYHDLTDKFYGTEVTVYTVTGDGGSEIGDYSANLSLGSTNFVWSDGTSENKTVTWRIVSGGVPTYADFAIDDGDEVYTGHQIEKNVICLRDGWNEGEHYTVTHTDNVNVGTATVMVSGTAIDATTGESVPWSLMFNFEIVRANPVLDFVNEGFTSHEDDGTFELRPYLSDEADLSDLVWTSSDESVATVDENGIVTLRGLGTAEITATLPGSENWNEAHDSYELTVNETQTEIVVVPGPGGSGGSGDGGVIYIPTVIREDAGISDLTWLIILACVVVVMLALIWLLWNRRTEGDGA